MAKKPKTWQIFVLRKNAKRIGTVDAADEKAAIEKALKELHVEPHERDRLMAVRAD